MKKRIFAILLSALLMASATACNQVPDNIPENETESTAEELNADANGISIIACGDHYCYYRIEGTFEYGCEIYGANGGIVFSEKTKRPMTVSEITPALIEIRIGYGTGINGRRYYSIETEKMSEEFFYVVANHGTKIAYVTYSTGDLNDRKLMVQDVFQPIDSGQSFVLDFSPTHTPVIEAEFLEGGSTFSLTYYEGQIYATKQAEFSLE